MKHCSSLVATALAALLFSAALTACDPSQKKPVEPPKPTTNAAA